MHEHPYFLLATFLLKFLKCRTAAILQNFQLENDDNKIKAIKNFYY